MAAAGARSRMLKSVKLTIDKMIYGGEGLARLPADEAGRGKAVFVPFVLPGEEVEAAVVEQKPGFARTGAPTVLRAAPERIPPKCRYFTYCGGCSYQHAGYAHQVEIKKQILRETLQRTAKIDWMQEIPAITSEPWHYRNRTRMRLRTDPFTLGYNRLGSSEILDAEECPISSPSILRGVQTVRTVAAEKQPPASIAEIEFFADDKDQRLLLECTIVPEGKSWEKPVLEFVSTLRATMPEIAGVGLMMESRRGVFTRQRPAKGADALGAQSLDYAVNGTAFRVSVGSFFQTNRFLTGALANVVTEGMQGRTVFDLYAGVGLFALSLEKSFERVYAVESSEYSFDDLEHNSKDKLRTRKQTVEAFLDEPPVKLGAQDAVVVDPPRAGLGERVARKLGSMKAGRLTYVSCDPATLSRDLRVLVESGYRVEQVSLVDLFPQTFHLETVVKLAR